LPDVNRKDHKKIIGSDIQEKVFNLSIKKGLKKKDIFFEKMKKWGSGSILDFKNHSSDDGLKKVKFSDDDQVPAFQSAYHLAT
jgi:hypothetical protein